MLFMKLRAKIADITRIATDAIVNAAHPSLEGGGGVDGAIHKASGPKLLEACKTYPVLEWNPKDKYGRYAVRCYTGEAKITRAFELPSKYVVHTPGPVYASYSPEEAAKLLRGCYQESLRLAVGHGCKSIAYPAISTGIFGYPVEDAAEVAVDAVRSLDSLSPDMVVVFTCFDDVNFNIYNRLLQA